MTAVLNVAKVLLLRRWPVWSKKEFGYTATTGFTLGSLSSQSSVLITVATSASLVTLKFSNEYSDSNKTQLESETIKRKSNSGSFAVFICNYKCNVFIINLIFYSVSF